MNKRLITKAQYYKMVGSLIKSIREEAKLSQQEVADIMGLKTYATVMEYESGNIAVPVLYLKRFAEHIGIDVRELLPKTYVEESTN